MSKKIKTRKPDLARRPGNSVDEVYRALYERIVGGVYPPRFKMSQMRLAQEFNVSRTPLREALNRLQAGGLVLAGANRGMEVASIRHADVEDGYAARLLLEPPLVAGLVNDFKRKDIDEMSEALNDMQRLQQRNQEFQQAHFRFHMVALQLYPRGIRDIVLNLYQQGQRHQCLHFSRPRVPEDFLDIDRAFLNAIKEANASKVRQLLELHLIDACIGMALDIDPDYVPTSLVLAANSAGIRLRPSQKGWSERPISIRWERANGRSLAGIRTSNLILP